MKIRTSQDLDKILQGVANELVQANVLYQLYLDLNEAFAGYIREVNESPAFWGQTRNSIFEAAMIRLCRVYDRGEKSNGIPSVLKEIHHNLHYFESHEFRQRLKDNESVDSLAETDRRPDNSQLLLDQEFCSEENISVKKLLAWRNNVFAHKSAKLTIKDQSLSSMLRMTFGDINLLLESGMKIVNRYSGLFRALSYSTNLIGHDDFKYVFKSLRNERNRRDMELRAECEKYGIPFPLDEDLATAE